MLHLHSVRGLLWLSWQEGGEPYADCATGHVCNGCGRRFWGESFAGAECLLCHGADQEVRMSKSFAAMLRVLEEHGHDVVIHLP